MIPILENRGVRILQLVQHVGVIVRHPRPKHVMVCPLDHTDGVDLDISQMLNGFQDPRFSESKRRLAIGQALGPEHDRADFGER